MNEDASFGHWVTLRRKALHFTRAGLAQRVGCAVVTLRKIEADERRPSEQIAERLADCLRLTPKDRGIFIRAARGVARVDKLSHPAVWEATVGEGPPIAQRRRRIRLPRPLTSLIGRVGEREELRQLLMRPDVRLVTLTGAPGIGKTRLALQTAIELSDAFSDSASFVQLAPIRDMHLVLPTIAQHLNVAQVPGRSTLEQLVAQLHDSRMLLVLDNFEQVAQAATHLAELLSATTQLKLLVTSRVALNLSGEQRFVVPPLASPDAHALASHSGPEDALSRYAATRLFLERVQAITSGLAPKPADARAIAHICQQLDGLPLAIELAAARMTLFSPQELLARLDHRLAVLTDGAVNLPERQRTLRKAIQWSYDLLDAEEQKLFRRLGVFSGGWTLAAAEAITEGAVISILQSLINKSLVKQEGAADGEGETRFGMLETLREYALVCLAESDEAEMVRQHHADFFVELAESIQPQLHGDERKVGYARLDAEQDNLRAVLGWAVESNQAELGLRLAGALGDYWYWWAGGWHEGWSWISQLLALPQAQQPSRARANALKAAVNLLRSLGDDAQAERISDESLALFRVLGDKAGIAWVLADMGPGACARADFALVEAACTESVALFQEIGDQRGLAWALTWLAAAACDQGHAEEAVEWIRRGLAAAQKAADDAIAGQLQLMLGDLAYDSNDFERAAAIQHLGMDLCQKGGDADGAYFGLIRLGRTSLAQGDIDLAASQLQACETRFRQTHQKETLCWMLHQLAYVKHLQGKDDEAGALLHEALPLQRDQQRKLLLIESLERCAWIAADQGRAKRAAHLFGAVEAQRHTTGSPLRPGDKPLYDRHLERVRADLDGPTFGATWAEGRAMTLEQAVEYALAEL